MGEHAHLTYGGIIIAFLLVTYAILGLLVEKYKCICGHEASGVVLIGMIISYIASIYEHDEFTSMMTFDPHFFFYFCLPPIVFASGFNMRRKTFFENFSNVLMFGLVSTVLQFFLFSLGTMIL